VLVYTKDALHVDQEHDPTLMLERGVMLR